VDMVRRARPRRTMRGLPDSAPPRREPTAPVLLAGVRGEGLPRSPAVRAELRNARARYPAVAGRGGARARHHLSWLRLADLSPAEGGSEWTPGTARRSAGSATGEHSTASHSSDHDAQPSRRDASRHGQQNPNPAESVDRPAPRRGAGRAQCRTSAQPLHKPATPRLRLRWRPEGGEPRVRGGLRQDVHRTRKADLVEAAGGSGGGAPDRQVVARRESLRQ
jgi:hypothetical protein